MKFHLLILGVVVSMALASVLDSFSLECHKAYTSCVENAQKDISEFTSIVDEGKCIPDFGEKCDSLCSKVLDEFTSSAPDSDDDPEKVAVFDGKVKELSRAVDSPLQVLYYKQLGLLREKALGRYRSHSADSAANDYEAMQVADAFFAKEAEAATRGAAGAGWDYAAEQAQLQSTMNELAARNKKLAEATQKAQASQQSILQYLQQQQAQIQALQQQLYGQQGSPWQLALAYRVPDTSINLSGAFQDGRTSIQMTCVPDSSRQYLGQHGFTYGVGPGNLGLSVNLNL
ncbi:unnamed protein product [Heterosigma akashiwo]|uniref:Uncharacterized protein n=1 Tax=Heterosigma akashiwo TaxID=2829 RepID=A0A6V1RWX3_HETAK